MSFVFFFLFFFVCGCFSDCMSVHHVHTWACGGQNTVLDSQKLEIELCWLWVLRIKVRSSGRATSALTHLLGPTRDFSPLEWLNKTNTVFHSLLLSTVISCSLCPVSFSVVVCVPFPLTYCPAPSCPLLWNTLRNRQQLSVSRSRITHWMLWV